MYLTYILERSFNIKADRQQKILEILEEEGKVYTQQLSILLSVSEDTIRRDFKEMDEKKLLKRVHSGAIRIGPPITNFQHRININKEEKQLLASKALALLKPNTTIIIDGGTTNLEFAKKIPLDFPGIIITNSPHIAIELESHENIDVFLLGGDLYKSSMISLGIDIINSLDTIRADMYIMGIHNIDIDDGITIDTRNEALVKKKMSEVSAEIIGIVTKNKIGTISNYIIGPANLLTYLVCDNLPEKIKTKLINKDIKLI